MPRHTVLLADDDPEALAMMSRYLELEGFNCLTAGDGDQALATVGAQNPEAVFLDTGMAGISSNVICRQMRAEAATSRTPVLMVALTPQEESAARDAGATAVLPKPFHLADLAATFRALFPDTPPPVG